MGVYDVFFLRYHINALNSSLDWVIFLISKFLIIIAEQDDDDVGKQRKLFQNMHKTAPIVSFNLFCVKVKNAMTSEVFQRIKDLLKGNKFK